VAAYLADEDADLFNIVDAGGPGIALNLATVAAQAVQALEDRDRAVTRARGWIDVAA
jgi:hypothetical protein